MDFDIDDKTFNEIAEIIHSDTSPVGIDAKKTHILILYKLQEIQNQLKKQEPKDPEVTKAQIAEISKEILIIDWQKKGVGFGQLTMEWNQEKQQFDLDSENMDVDTVIEIFKALDV